MKTRMLIVIIIIGLFGNAYAESIHEYARDGNVKEVKRLIKEGVDVNAEDNYGETALMQVAWHTVNVGHTEVARLHIPVKVASDSGPKLPLTLSFKSLR